jgi:hypothetical protein
MLEKPACENALVDIIIAVQANKVKYFGQILLRMQSDIARPRCGDS